MQNCSSFTLWLQVVDRRELTPVTGRMPLCDSETQDSEETRMQNPP